MLTPDCSWLFGGGDLLTQGFPYFFPTSAMMVDVNEEREVSGVFFVFLLF